MDTLETRPAVPNPAAGKSTLTRLGAVRWLSPTELVRTGLKAVLAGVFGQYADRREMQQGPMFEQSTFPHTGDGEFWFDYVSDIGDGFDATYSVASLLASDLDLPEAGGVLPRGSVLVMGGDQVYPFGDVEAYEQRTTKVYAAAFPEAAGGNATADSPVLYAVPGNHDWYDGLTAFLRVFGQQENIGGWCTRQKRSYFALDLPHGWWLMAIDIQLDTYIDKPQLEYFKKVAEKIGDNDSVIVCTAVPSWYEPTESSIDRLAYFLRYSLGERARQVRVVLTGDVHHYARYQSDQPDTPILVTAGTGGAYTSATHLLPEELPVSAKLSDTRAEAAAKLTYKRRGETWPPRPESSRVSWTVLWRLAARNWTLLLVFAGLYGLLAAGALLGSWLWVVALLALAGGGAVAFTKPRTGSRGRRWRYGVGLALVQLAPAIAMVWWIPRIAGEWGWLERAGVVAGAAVAGGVLVAELLAAWLLVVSRREVNVNELFAALSIEDYKGFLRCRIERDGTLSIFPIGLRKSVRDWEPATGDKGPRLVPKPPEKLDVRLIEPPVRVRS
ncbi:metallophosphoesterase family protein [Micromonospora sp. CPCC 206061]|uniref:metallophosphoesterase family protein n=1 Tax=Micromonospora sp. CPCC 206061 TaxID=3122410 RepID=UPI002FF43B39